LHARVKAVDTDEARTLKIRLSSRPSISGFTIASASGGRPVEAAAPDLDAPLAAR
jgi:hypothetical protein